MSIRTPDTKVDFFLTAMLTFLLALPIFVEINIYSIVSLLLSAAIGALGVSGVLRRYKVGADVTEKIENAANEVIGFIVMVPIGLTALALVAIFFWLPFAVISKMLGFG